MPGQGAPRWYTFPFANDFGGKEPFGNFPKPDINVQVPDNYQITTLLPGTVTSVDTSSAWGCAVTIRLDKPYNPLATHIAYLHLSQINVPLGAHVNAGDLIGLNGGGSACGSQKVPLGVAFYPDDAYGYGPAWNTYFQSTSTPQLNPFDLIQSFASGNTNLPLSYYQGSGSATPNPQAQNTGACAPWDIACLMRNFSGVLPRIGEGILGGILLIIGLLLAIKQISGLNVGKLAKVLA